MKPIASFNTTTFSLIVLLGLTGCIPYDDSSAAENRNIVGSNSPLPYGYIVIDEDKYLYKAFNVNFKNGETLYTPSQGTRPEVTMSAQEVGSRSLLELRGLKIDKIPEKFKNLIVSTEVRTSASEGGVKNQKYTEVIKSQAHRVGYTIIAADTRVIADVEDNLRQGNSIERLPSSTLKTADAFLMVVISPLQQEYRDGPFYCYSMMLHARIVSLYTSEELWTNNFQIYAYVFPGSFREDYRMRMEENLLDTFADYLPERSVSEFPARPAAPSGNRPPVKRLSGLEGLLSN